MKKENNYFSEYVSINGIDQYLLHYRSTNPTLPVLLFIHGGPGLAESTFSYAFQKGLCDLYTVVYWDQRGAGKTLTKNKNLYPSIEESLDDMQQVVTHLKTKYAKEQIVILGHSFGSMLGSLFVLRHPEDGMSNNKPLWNFMFSHSLYDETPNYEIPVYYIIGERDFQAPRTIAQVYFERINAPEKRFLIVKNAGHYINYALCFVQMMMLPCSIRLWN
jgi:Lysophospholipase